MGIVMLYARDFVNVKIMLLGSFSRASFILRSGLLRRFAPASMAPPSSCFFPVPADSPFSIHNLPYGVFRPFPSSSPRPGVAIGDYVLDLSVIATSGLFQGPLLSSSNCFLQQTLNSFMALGRPAWKEARATLQKLLSGEEPGLQDDLELKKKALIPMNEVKMELPAAIGDYTDFFASEYHTKNCSKIFRGEFALPPNWLHLPVAYHGRASSVVISGTNIVRPKGQAHPPNPDGKTPPYFGPSKCLDYELEMAFFVGPGNELGQPIAVENAYDHVFGLVLMNDWSARDIQFWESQPLGPFLGKSLGTSISPWIITLDALEPFKCQAPKQDPPCLPYLTEGSRFSYDIPLEIAIKPAGEEKQSVVCRTNFKYLYWTMAQQLAHHTINGCNLRAGDLLASGTISGPERSSMGCLLELTTHGKEEVALEHGGVRKYLEDGDEVIFSGGCKGDGFAVGFGTCRDRLSCCQIMCKTALVTFGACSLLEVSAKQLLIIHWFLFLLHSNIFLKKVLHRNHFKAIASIHRFDGLH